MEFYSFILDKFKMSSCVNKIIPDILAVSFDQKLKSSGCIHILSFCSPFFKIINFLDFIIECIIFASFNLSEGIFLKHGESISSIEIEESIDKLFQCSICSYGESPVFRLILNMIQTSSIEGLGQSILDSYTESFFLLHDMSPHDENISLSASEDPLFVSSFDDLHEF